MIAPSGKQITIMAKDQQAVVVEVGGGVRSYSVGGRELLDGYGVNEMSSSGRGQVLIPWPNRLQDGSYEFNGRRYQLPLNEPEHRNAIHGLVRWSTWTATEREPHRVVMEHILYPQPGYPFLLGISIEYALSDSGLQVRTIATNLGAEPCPYGSGAHPYLTLGTETVDGLILHVPGRTVLRSDERGLSIQKEAVEGTEYDFRQPKRIGSIKLDHAFTDLERDADGLARVKLRDSGDRSDARSMTAQSRRNSTSLPPLIAQRSPAFPRRSSGRRQQPRTEATRGPRRARSCVDHDSYEAWQTGKQSDHWRRFHDRECPSARRVAVALP
jgi:aldose 1-epimerase